MHYGRHAVVNTPVVAGGSVSSRPQPTLDLSDLVLRPWAASDADAISAAYDDPEIQYWHARSMTYDEATDWIKEAHADWAEEAAASWAVANGSHLVGRTTLKLHLEDGWAEAAYWVVGMPHKPFVARAAGPSRWRACTASSWSTPLATSPPVVQLSRLALSRRALSGVIGCTSTAFTTCTFTPLSRWLSRVYAARRAAKRGTQCPAGAGSHRSSARQQPCTTPRGGSRCRPATSAVVIRATIGSPSDSPFMINFLPRWS
jgi:Acetyltransferase (GNAT) domain